MALDAQKCRDALVGLGPEQPVFIDPPAHFRAWLAEKGLPGDVVEFLLHTSVAENVPFPSGCGGVWPPRDIMALNDQEADILAAGLFAVGNSTDGDFIVIDLRDERRQAGFVSHDELWEGKAWTDVQEIFARVADSLDEMLAGMSSDHCPQDYYDALSWRKDT